MQPTEFALPFPLAALAALVALVEIAAEVAELAVVAIAARQHQPLLRHRSNLKLASSLSLSLSLSLSSKKRLQSWRPLAAERRPARQKMVRNHRSTSRNSEVATANETRVGSTHSQAAMEQQQKMKQAGNSRLQVQRSTAQAAIAEASEK